MFDYFMMTYDEAILAGFKRNPLESAMWLREGLNYIGCNKCWKKWNIWKILGDGRHDFPA